MTNNLGITQNVSLIAVFSVGFLSFFSACVLPLIPIYMSYLSGEGKKQTDGKIIYSKKTTIINTLFFVLGISTVFFILGLGAFGLGQIFIKYNSTFTKVAGIIIIVFGLFQLNIIKLNFLNTEKKLNTNINPHNMTFIKAYLMGLSFSFAWTPCTGVTLGSVLLYASTSGTILYGNFLILVYALGFSIPFLILGLFTTSILNFFKNKGKVILWASRIGGIILILIGLITFLGLGTTINRIFT